ncbi:uncharacterized protein LOC136088341 [Hydra vulgaris]|uniref:Uncharacterized protein LOC136088341 n=1 Tax=Hydra vulgaris TaxID=6087 RepID=A0ABM4D1H9_HYDVU
MNVHRLLIQRRYEEGLTGAEIFKLAKVHGINERCVYRTIQRLRETGGVEDLEKSVRPRSVRTPDRIKRIREKIRRNPERSARKLPQVKGVLRESMRELLKLDLGLKPYRKHKVHGLTANQKLARLQRCITLLREYDHCAVQNIIFSDEKLFVMEQSFNAKNNVVWSTSLKDIPQSSGIVQWYQNRSLVMVWAAVCSKGKLPFVFIERGTKINAVSYQESVLKAILQPEANLLYRNGDRCFQQDSAPAHTAKTTQEWLQQNCPKFIAKDECPLSSPDLNPLDY